MKNLLTALALGALSFSSACRDAASADNATIHVSSHTQVSAAAHDNTGGDICATFTLTPYSFDSSGTPAQAGPPVTFTTSDTSASTDQILGCIASPDNNFDYVAPANSDYASGSYNWAYLVSATGFQYCDSSISPPLDTSTLTAAPAYFAPVECEQGVDTQLSIDYPVAIAEASSAGYVDISAGVDAVNQYVGCKQADTTTNPDGTTQQFHFGESFTADDNSNVPWGLVGFTLSPTSADSVVAQYGDQVYAPDPNASSSTLYDNYYTGQFTTDANGLPSSVFQTFLTNDPGIDQPGTEQYDYGLCIDNGGSCDAWVDTRHAICVTTPVEGSAGQFTTAGVLADAFIFIPSMGFAAASVTGAGAQITLYSQVLPNSNDDYTSAQGSGATMNGSPSFSSSMSNVSSQAGFNDGLLTETFNASDSPGLIGFNGIYVDPLNIGQFIVGGATASGNVWASLSDTGSGWTIGTFADVSSAPEGYAEEQTGCLYLCDDD